MQVFEIPIKPHPNQKISAVLGGQDVVIELVWRNERLYASVRLNQTDVVCNRLCHNREPIVREAYRGFVGDLLFEDISGCLNPHFAQLGSRFKLFWVNP